MIATLCEQRPQVVARLGKIRLQRERALERRACAGGLAAFRQQRAQAVERGGMRARLHGTLEGDDRGRLEPLIEQLTPVGQIVTQGRR